MKIVLRLGGQVVVNDKGDLLDINATCQKISGYEHTRGAGPELAHDDVTGVLVHVTMGGRDSVVPAAHLVSQPVNLAAGVDKDDTLRDGKSLVEVTESVKLPLFLLDVDIELLDALESQLISLDKDADWFVHELAGDFKRFWGHSGREDTNLDPGGQKLENLIDLEGRERIGVREEDRTKIKSFGD